MMHPLRYYAAGRGFSDSYGYAQRTRFIPDAMRPLFAESQARPDAEREDAGRGDFAATSTASIRAGMKAMWE